MTKLQAKKQFIETILGSVPLDDAPGLNEAWGRYTDELCKTGSITPYQYNIWVSPRFTKLEHAYAFIKYKNEGTK
jgi:hypothetical protein